MSSRGSQSSQMGLFTTQISEQIVRLRALGQSAEGSTDNNTVEVRRAIMATRLLSGSARILNLAFLPEFLDELLAWLQTVEQHPGGLSTTQTLILESVIELEESLMLELDEDDFDAEAALGPLREQIEDLLTLVRRNTQDTGASPLPDDAEEGLGDFEDLDELADETDADLDEIVDHVTGAKQQLGEDRGSADVELGEVLTPSEELSGVLARAGRDLELVLDGGFEDAAELADVWNEVESQVGQLRAQLEDLARRGREAEAVVALDREDETRGPALEEPEKDEVLGPALGRLKAALVRARAALLFRGYGGATAVHPQMRALTRQLLESLVDDVAAAIEHGGELDNEHHSYHVSIELRADEGALHAIVSDDAPRSDRGAMFGETDHLALLGGLRRARNLLAQSQGLIRVEPEESPEQRYVLTLPLDPKHPRFTLIRIASGAIAVPSTLVEGLLPAAGLIYESDLNGDSFEWEGRNVPLVDLSHYVTLVPTPDAPPDQLAVCGIVEKRLALPCDGTIELHEDPKLVDPPEEWASVAFGAFEVDGQPVPVLDISRLLRLRFRMFDETGVSGAMVDPEVDAYEPVSADAESMPAKGAARGTSADGRAPLRTVLLVNQSEFRRKDLARTLQGMGFTVSVAEDLKTAASILSTQTIGLLVTDLRLGQEGGESLADLRSRHPGLGVILTSSVASQYADELAEKTGADRVWLDPYRKSDLQGLLSELQR